MAIYAIADPHLSGGQHKPMSIFGEQWQGHPDIFFERWRATVTPKDTVLVPGDISWAMRLEDAQQDLDAIAALPGRKVISKGNHDYWWASLSKLRSSLAEGMYALQNDALRLEQQDGPSLVVAAARGWNCPNSFDFSEHDVKIYHREAQRFRLSLEDAKRQRREGDRFIAMLHYPPCNKHYQQSLFLDLLLEYEPETLVFGHIHGKENDFTLKAWGKSRLALVSADTLAFIPLLL